MAAESHRKRRRSDVKQESAVEFATVSRVHMGLAVKDLEQSVAFYRSLFGQEPTKTRPGYAKFEVAEPPVNLSLNVVGGETGQSNPVAHFGIQVKSTPAVIKVAERLEAAGIATTVEDHVTCCYAVQNKIWATDPDGNKWEAYVVLDNDGAHHATTNACCPQETKDSGCCSAKTDENCCAESHPGTNP
jgi:catechol 2,3-dioxygenase-like lactoylglutathione lyase family enzyme